MTQILEVYDGTLIDALNPQPKDFKLKNIFNALIKLPRFGGNSCYHYSVMHHSICCYHEAVARGYDHETLRLVFCHDFSESTCGDLPKPLKNVCPEYERIELMHQEAIYDRFGVTGDIELLHEVDRDMAVYEARYLMPSQGCDHRWFKPSREYPESPIVNEIIKNPLSERECEIYFHMITQVLDIR